MGRLCGIQRLFYGFHQAEAPAAACAGTGHIELKRLIRADDARDVVENHPGGRLQLQVELETTDLGETLPEGAGAVFLDLRLFMARRAQFILAGAVRRAAFSIIRGHYNLFAIWERGDGARLRLLGGGMLMQPVKPHPMQQYDFFPILNPLEVDQRTFFNLQFGQ